jgi:hypothetical protein
MVSGCGSGFKVTGKVTFSDGQPLTVGKVIFTNGQISAYGKINSNGEYRLGLIKDGDGIPAGTYQVYITEAFQLGDNYFDQCFDRLKNIKQRSDRIKVLCIPIVQKDCSKNSKNLFSVISVSSVVKMNY